jgi:hypothetical protein
VIEFINDYIKAQNKNKNFKISVLDLETYLENQFKDLSSYDNHGGYKAFYESIKTLDAEGRMKPVKATEKKITNGKRFSLSLPVFWWVVMDKPKQNWSVQDMMKVSSVLDMDYYEKHALLQTKRTWEIIIKLYDYLKQNRKTEWVSKQERAYQIFGYEKALDSDDEYGAPCNKVLSKIGLSLDALKIKEYGEPFVYWIKPKQNPDTISHILITENLSFFHSCKRYLMNHNKIYGEEYQMIIYGEGRHIENSLTFLYEIIEHSDYIIDYVGDIDPSGIDIYCNLKERYPFLSLKLAMNIYVKMIENATTLNVVKEGQKVKEEKYESFLKEVERVPELVNITHKVRSERIRVPQETISYEHLVRSVQ